VFGQRCREELDYFISKDRKVFSFWQGKENTFLRVK
jgi:hypothetical protein